MSSGTTPLLDRQPTDLVAIRDGAPVTMGSFLGDVYELAGRLPTTGAIVNLCDNRYRFLVGFAAALTRGLTTLLPPNRLDSTVTAIVADWPDHSVLVDDAVVFASPISRTDNPSNPEIPDNLLAGVAYTSGTTGSSLPQPKTWRGLVEAQRFNRAPYIGEGNGPFGVVATVPPQHMYGMEGTILAALRTPVVMHDGRPFYPADVAAALAETPAPRVLISTPVHLRALVGSGVTFPPVARVLSATAPLDSALAAAVESRFGGVLIEIYGCSELGSLASRRAARDDPWQLFPGFTASFDDGATALHAPHLASSFQLPDQLDFDSDGRFRLAGREADMIKIGGKRSSLAEITRHLLAVEGVADVVVFPRPEGGDEARLAALVVPRGTLDPVALRTALARVLDPVFIPRHFVAVPSLPRASTGKLPRDAVLDLWRRASVADVQP